MNAMNEGEENQDTVRARYELSFLVRTEDAGANVSAIVSRHGGEISFQSPVTQVRLAYPIKKEASAYFGFIQFSIARDQIKNVHDVLSRESAVLRFLIVHPPIERAIEAAPKIETPTPVEPAPVAKPVAPRGGITTNEALEKRLEEILK